MRLRPKELGRRLAVAGALLLLPVIASSSGTLLRYAFATAAKLAAVVRWGWAIAEVFGASTFFMLSVLCCTGAALAVVLAATRVLAGRSEELERPYLLLRALVLLHGAVGPFLALSATQHLSPTGRGRPVLARYLAVVLEHQAFLAFATAAIATAWLVSFAALARRPTADVVVRLRAARPFVAAYVACGAASRVIGQTFATAADGAPVASALELELALAIAGVALTSITASLLAARALPAVPVATEDDGAPPRKPLATALRTTATLLLPLFSLTVVSWASSRPCDPNADELANVPTVAARVALPLPLARAEGETSADEGVLVADASRRLRDIWPKRAGAREIRLAVQRDAFERGQTGIFARFGDGRFGVMRMTFADRDGAPQTCATLAKARCIDVSAGDVTTPLAAVRASQGTPSFVYRVGADETVGQLAHDAATLLQATYDSMQTRAIELDVDFIVALPPEPAPKASRVPVSPPKVAPRTDEQDLVLPSAGCTVAHAAVSFEPHEIETGGTARRLFVSAPAASEGVRSLVIVLHGDGSSAKGIRGSLPLEAHLGATSVFVYPEARAQQWDVDAPLASNADIAFVRAAIAWAESSFCVDQHRRFVAGLGSAGHLANALACEGGLRAVVSDAPGGPAPSDDEPDAPSGLFRCKPAAALVFHEADDSKVATTDGVRWRVVNRCGPSAEADPSDAACEVFRGCDHPALSCLAPGLGQTLADDGAARSAVLLFSRASEAPRPSP